MKHIMIDIETLGLRPDAVITEVAAVMWDTKTDSITHLCNVRNLNVREQMSMGRTISPGTLSWAVNTRDYEVTQLHTDYSYSDLNLADLRAALKLHVTCDTDTLVWSKGVVFDIAKLESLYYNNPSDVPWTYKQVMCFRTLLRQYNSEDTLNILSACAKHTAAEDAYDQLTMLRRIILDRNIVHLL